MLESAEFQADSVLAGAEVAVEAPPAFKKKGIGVVSWIAIGWLGLITSLAILAPYLPIKDPQFADFARPSAGFFTPGHLLGTDDAGSDVLSRAIWGARSSLAIAIGAVLVGVVVGGFLGLYAGFRGKKTDTVLSSLFNILLAFPQLVLALTLVSVLAPAAASGGSESAGHDFYSKRLFTVIIAVGIVSIPILARITRANTLAWSQREFVMAARAQGAKDRRVMFRDVLPNVLPAILSIALLGVAIVIVLEGALAIFGLSIPLPYASWGNMINSQISQLDAAPQVWLVPSILIVFTVLSLNYLGDVVRSHFDVRESAI
jgi:peptide/nickel transport system permease protein